MKRRRRFDCGNAPARGPGERRPGRSPGPRPIVRPVPCGGRRPGRLRATAAGTAPGERSPADIDGTGETPTNAGSNEGVRPSGREWRMRRRNPRTERFDAAMRLRGGLEVIAGPPPGLRFFFCSQLQHGSSKLFKNGKRRWCAVYPPGSSRFCEARGTARTRSRRAVRLHFWERLGTKISAFLHLEDMRRPGLRSGGLGDGD